MFPGFVHNCQKRKQLVLQLVNDTLYEIRKQWNTTQIFKKRNRGYTKQYIFENEMKNIPCFYIKS